jgi:hypothetical protein
MKSVGTFVKIETVGPGGPPAFTPIPKLLLDTTILDDFVNNADFSNEVNVPIKVIITYFV